MFMVLYIIEKVNGGLFGGGLPPDGQVQMIVRGKCEYKISLHLYKIDKATYGFCLASRCPGVYLY